LKVLQPLKLGLILFLGIESHGNILAWIYERLTEPMSWKILPLTRPKELIAPSSLYTALISLMYEVYTDQQRTCKDRSPVNDPKQAAEWHEFVDKDYQS